VNHHRLVVVANTLSRQGYRWVHLLSMDGVIDAAAAYASYIPAEAEEVERCAWEEKTLGAHHLTYCWPARELIKLVRPGQPGHAVLWWVGNKSALEMDSKATVREAIDLAGILYRLRVGKTPTRALIGKKPAAAANVPTVAGLELVEEGWVPSGFVVIE
jgi:hypothetical protein